MIREKNDLYKEVLTILSYFSNDLIDKIPDNVLSKIRDLAVDSNSDFSVDTEKSLNYQEISEESKDLISLIYYNYIADENEKSELLKSWNENENKYQEELRKKFAPDNLFQHKIKETPTAEIMPSSDTAMFVYKKETLFSKIKNFIKKILKK